MSRRHAAEKKVIPGDPVYGSVVLERFINKVMLHGKKSVARKIVYGALNRFAKRLGLENPLEGFEEALENAKPILEVRSAELEGLLIRFLLKWLLIEEAVLLCSGLSSMRALSQANVWKLA